MNDQNKSWGQPADYTAMPLAQLFGLDKKQLSESDFVIVRDRLLSAWNDSKRQLEVAKEAEMELRKQFVSFAFDSEKLSGTENIELGNGYKAKAVKKINFGFIKNADNKVDKVAIDSALDKIEAMKDQGGMLIAERLVKWTPDLSLTEYKQLSPEMKAIIDEVIVTSEGSPTLEIIAPKGK